MVSETKTPTIGILYESDEWSDHKLARELRNALVEEGCEASVVLIGMESSDAIKRALACDLLISRVFASARFRGHEASLARMEELLPAVTAASIPMLNCGSAHRFEVSKQASTAALSDAGLTVPRVFACAEASDIEPATLPYPCIIKPYCGGRTTLTEILRDASQASAFLEAASQCATRPNDGHAATPNDRHGSALPEAIAASPSPTGSYSKFIVEEYIEPELGFLTRIEIVDGRVALVVKRSIAESGLSGYHEGSTYASYDDCPPELVAEAERAAQTLGFDFGSFDVIECARGRFFIDANSVSNVSADCTELLGCDLMALHARTMAKRFAWRGAEFVEPGFHITDDCIECGNCHDVCPSGAIVEKRQLR